jgi:hypothetical protein
MKKGFFGILLVLLYGAGTSIWAQFMPEELEQRAEWEEFLTNAEVVDQEQMISRRAVTSPWVLSLEKDQVKNKGLWKNPSGRMSGYFENWKWEIAAYRLDKLLGLNMVPPTVERRFAGDRGSCQLWIDGCMTAKEKTEKKIKTPSYKIFHWNRALYLQRAFDNLIANEDRHQNQYLVTADFRMILIDHSRSFHTSKKHTRNLIYSKKSNEQMKQLPADFVDKLKALDFAQIREAVGEYLTDKEIESVLLRRDLIVKAVEDRIAEMGEDKVLY